MIYDRILALIGCLTISAIWWSSDVSLNFYLQSDLITEIVGGLYIFCLLAVVIRPDKPQIHFVLPMVGFIYWTGRAAAFLELILNGTNTTLWGAVAERVLIAALLMYWHYWSVHRQQWRTSWHNNQSTISSPI